MVIHELDGPATPQLQQALAEFEATFRAPFAPGRFFHVRYGGDRTAFSRTLGESRCLAAEHEGQVIGFFEMSVVNLLMPDGEARKAVYFPNIKLLPSARGKVAAARLIQAGIAWGFTKSDIGFVLALDGTPMTPADYTGRAGIPQLAEAGRTVLARLPLPSGGGMLPEDGPFVINRGRGVTIFRKLVLGRHAVLGGSPAARSVSPPVWMAHPSGLACGRFEDRRKVKQLITDDGKELRPAYLSCFAFKDAEAAVALLVAALRRAKSLGFGALRICLAPTDMALLEGLAGQGTIEQRVGTIFSTANANSGAAWTMNAAEV